MTDLAPLRRNRLLALLDDRTLKRIAADFEFVELRLRDLVMREGKPIRHAWFPTDGVLSQLAPVEDGRNPVEVGTIGNEGVGGLALFLADGVSTGDCFVQVPGHAWRMPAADFAAAAHRHRDFTAILHRFTHALLVQSSQSAACNRVHTPHQRCARWLLMTADRVQNDEFQLTQEFLSNMLGERRVTVSRAESSLRDRRLIEYSRGKITVLDREGLEHAACPCYRVIRDAYDRALGVQARKG